MPRTIRLIPPLLTSLVLALGVGCSPGGEDPSAATASRGGTASRVFPPAPQGVIRINLGAEPTTLDPTLSTDIPASKVLRHLHEGLVRLDSDCRPMPGIAETWEPDPAYRKWTFHLRTNARWSNGDPVTAHDFVYGLQRILTPDTGAQYAYMVYGFLEGGEEYYESGGQDAGNFGATAVDDHTLEIRLAAPAHYFPTMLGHPAWYAIHRGTVEKHGSTWANSPATYVSNGPYILKEWRPKDRLIAVSNPAYHLAGEVQLDQIVFRMIENQGTELAAFESGELDITSGVLTTEIDRLRQTPEYVQPPYFGTYYVTFNMTRPPFDNPALRKALALAIPREIVVEKITRRGETPATGFVPHGTVLPDGRDFRDISGHLTGPADYSQRLALAKEILAEAGLDSPAQLPRFEYLYNTQENHKRIGELLQNQWEQNLGVKVSLQNVEFKVKIARGQEKQFDAMRSGWIGDYLHPLSFLDMFMTGGGNNDAGYANPRYDELIELGRQEADPARSFEYLAEAERLLIEEDCVIAPIYEYTEPLLVRTEVKNYVRNALGDLDVSRAYRE